MGAVLTEKIQEDSRLFRGKNYLEIMKLKIEIVLEYNCRPLRCTCNVKIKRQMINFGTHTL